MKEKNNYKIIILLFSILLGFFASGLLRSKIPSLVPFSIQSIEESKAELDLIKKEIEEMDNLLIEKNKKLDMLDSLSDDEARKLLVDEIEQLRMTSGFIAMEGQGIKISMEDRTQNSLTGEELNLEVIHDADVLRIINDLKLAGAEAISVNGQRVISQSEIKCGGPIIRINGKSLATPFIIEAIGDPKLLSASVNAPNTYGYGLKHIDQIEFKTEVKDRIRIEAYEGRFNYRYAEKIGEDR